MHICSVKRKNDTATQQFEHLDLAGEEGFEPPNAGTKNQCLTTWRLPIVGSPYCSVLLAQKSNGYNFTFYR